MTNRLHAGRPTDSCRGAAPKPTHTTRGWPALLTLAALACDPAPAADNSAASKPVSEAKAEPAQQPKCRDYSELDPSTLPDLPDTPYTATFLQVWETVLTKHFDPTLGCVDWPAVRAEYGEKLRTAEGPEAAYRLMNEMLGRLGQSHFWVSSRDAQGPAPKGPARIPIELRWIEDTVTVVDNDVDGHTTKIPTGAEVIAIGDTEVAKTIAAAKKQAEGPTTFVHALDRNLEYSLRCKPGDPVDVVYTPLGADKPTTAKVVCQMPKVELLSVGNLTDIPTRISSRMLEGPDKLGYIAFNFWMLPMVADVEKRLGELRAAGMRGLVVDLRGNPGGVGAMSVPIARMLLPGGGSLGTLKFRDFEQTFNVAKNPQAFAGPIVILVDEGTASTSEIFAAGMRDLGRVKIAGGGPSAGAALPSLIQQLDGGAMLQYVVGDYHSSKGAVAEGDGVAPDIAVVETRKTFAEGKDLVLEAGVKHLREQLKTTATPG